MKPSTLRAGGELVEATFEAERERHWRERRSALRPLAARCRGRAGGAGRAGGDRGEVDVLVVRGLRELEDQRRHFLAAAPLCPVRRATRRRRHSCSARCARSRADLRRSKLRVGGVDFGLRAWRPACARARRASATRRRARRATATTISTMRSRPVIRRSGRRARQLSRADELVVERCDVGQGLVGDLHREVGAVARARAPPSCRCRWRRRAFDRSLQRHFADTVDQRQAVEHQRDLVLAGAQPVSVNVGTLPGGVARG